MPQNPFDRSATVNLACPSCNKKTPQTIATLEMSPRLRCPVCGMLFKVDWAKLSEKLKKATPKITIE